MHKSVRQCHPLSNVNESRFASCGQPFFKFSFDLLIFSFESFSQFLFLASLLFFSLFLLHLPVLTSQAIHHSIQIFTSPFLQGPQPGPVMCLLVRVEIRKEDFPSASFISFSLSYLLVIYGFVFIVAARVRPVLEESWSGICGLRSLFIDAPVHS